MCMQFVLKSASILEDRADVDRFETLCIYARGKDKLIFVAFGTGSYIQAHLEGTTVMTVTYSSIPKATSRAHHYHLQ